MNQNQKKFLGRNQSYREKVLIMATIAILSALSVVMIMVVPTIPIFPAVSWMRYDMADVPILVGSLLLGPLHGMIILVITAAIQAFPLGMDGLLGFIMHVIASGTLLLIASVIYRNKKTFASLITGLILGSLGMTAIMVFWNLIITPIFLNAPIDVVLSMMVPFIIPFNLIKAGLNSLITGVVFYSLKPLQSKIFRLDNKKTGQHA